MEGGKALKGWVYVITNRAMPGLVKIGYSNKDPDLRAAELNHTGAPFPYLVDYEALVHEPFSIEQRTHKSLSHLHQGETYQKGVGVEWFNCSVEEAISAIKIAAGDALISEEYKKADRAKAEELYAQKTKLEHEKREREEAERILEQQISNEESEITRTYQHLLELEFDEKPFWVYWLGGAVLSSIAVSILLPKAEDAAIFWISAICGAGIGVFLQSYLEDKKKNSARYISIEKERDEKLKETRVKIFPCKGCNTNYKWERKIDLLSRVKNLSEHALTCPKCKTKIPYPWPI